MSGTGAAAGSRTASRRPSGGRQRIGIDSSRHRFVKGELASSAEPTTQRSSRSSKQQAHRWRNTPRSNPRRGGSTTGALRLHGKTTSINNAFPRFPRVPIQFSFVRKTVRNQLLRTWLDVPLDCIPATPATRGSPARIRRSVGSPDRRIGDRKSVV